MNRRRMRHTNELRPNIAQFHGSVNMFHKFSIEKTQNFKPSSPSRDASKVGYVSPFIPKHDTIIIDAAAHCKHFFNLFLSHSKPVSGAVLGGLV